jgi:hypothetical protein
LLLFVTEPSAAVTAWVVIAEVGDNGQHPAGMKIINESM